MVVTGLILLAVLAMLVASRASPDIVLLGGLAALVVVGVLPPARALEGFANPGVATLGALFVVAEGLRRTGGVQFISRTWLRPTRSERAAQVCLLVPSALMSAVMNNTPVVAILMPLVRDFARRCGITESRLLMPLSYASILGGLLTLMGTSTTLVVDGLLQATEGQRGFGLFEIGGLGVPLVLVGLAFLVGATRWLLPERQPAIGADDDPRQYTVEMLVEPHSPIAGQTILEAGLRQLPGLFLAELVREGHVLPAVGPDTRLLEGDRLIFVGVVDSVVDLRRIRGLIPATDQQFELDGPPSERCLVEAVVSNAARFEGMNIREAQFRTWYQAAVIAVARHGARIHKKVGDIRLQAGDTLLLEARPSFVELHRNSMDFFMVRAIDDSTPLRHDRAWVSRAILVVMVALVVLGGLSMLQAALLACLLLIVSRCLTVGQVRGAIDWTVILGVGAGIGLGTAMSDTGMSALLGRHLADLAPTPLTSLALVCAITMVLANLITTKAAAMLMFPVALAVSEAVGASFRPFAVALVASAACAFATPVGYPTNLMVYGPGGYRSADFVRMGGPLSLIALGTICTVAPWLWPF